MRFFRRISACTLIPLSRAAVGLVLATGSLAARELDEAPRPPRDGAERDHRLGVQAGGSAFFQIAYRYRLVQPVFLDTGLFGAPHAMNGSAGLIVEAPISLRWIPYAGAGGGFGAAFGDRVDPECEGTTEECPTVSSSVSALFVHGRLGIAHALGAERRHFVSVDVGVWYGTLYEDDAGTETQRPLLWPMAGLAYHYAL